MTHRCLANTMLDSFCNVMFEIVMISCVVGLLQKNEFTKVNEEVQRVQEEAERQAKEAQRLQEEVNITIL